MKVSFKTLLAGTLVAGVSTGLATTASAQAPTVPTQEAAKPFVVKLGATFPTDGDVKDALGSTWFGFGLGYDIGKTKTSAPVVYGAYLDGTFASKNGNEASAYGIGPSARPAGAGGQPHFATGATPTRGPARGAPRLRRRSARKLGRLWRGEPRMNTN